MFYCHNRLDVLLSPNCPIMAPGAVMRPDSFVDFGTINQGGHTALKVLEKSIHFSRTCKVFENRIGSRWFWNVM